MADNVKTVSVRLQTTGYEDAKLKIDKLTVAAKEFGAQNPKIQPEIDAQKALLEARLLRDGIKKELTAGVMGITPSVSGAGAAASASSLSSFVTPMTALIAAAVALSPVLITIGTGLAGFGAAAAGAVAPVIKAAQATGGLSANMGKLTGPQRQVAAGFLSLQGSFDKFAKSMQPQVFSALNNGLAIARTLMKETGPVAKATGTALDQVLASVNRGLQSAQWRQFFSWMATNAGPDVLLVGKAIGTLVNDLPPLLEALQPVATSVLGLTVDLGQLVGVIEKVTTAEGKFASAANHSSGAFGTLWGAAKQAFGQLVPGAAAVSGLKDALNKSAPAAAKAGSSIKTLGSAAQTSAGEVTALYNALHKLLDPLTQNIQDAVTFKNDQNALADALRKSHGWLGLHTAAQRMSAQAAATAAQGALTVSNEIYSQTKSAQKAIAPLQSLASELERNGAKGAYARRILRELQAAIDALHGKTVAVNIVTTSTGAVLGVPGGGHPLQARASGGWASGWTLAGERGPELLYTPGSQVFTAPQSAAMLSGRSGGSTYNIHVSALVADRNTGRLVVEAIKKFEQGSGHGWRK